MKTPRLRRLVVLTAALTLGLGSGAALAYWRTTGSGSGSASVAGAANAVTIATNGTVTGLLQPGGTGDLVISVTNPNSFPVRIVSVSGGTASPSGGIGTCTTTGVSVSVPSVDLPAVLPANASGTRIVLSGAVAMSPTSDTGCQDATFTIPLTLAVQQ